MPVKVIRPVLSDEEREKRMQAVDAAVFKAMQAAEAERQAQKKSAPRPERQYQRTCKMCGSDFVSNACNTMYCAECKDVAYKMRYKELYRQRYNAKKRLELQQRWIDGVVYVCQCCGKRIMVHERTNRRICDACMERKGGKYRERLLLRKDIEEEVLD